VIEWPFYLTCSDWGTHLVLIALGAINLLFVLLFWIALLDWFSKDH